MRQAIFDMLFNRMARDETVSLVISDMGLGLIERFQEAYPDRFINVGIAEHSMIGVAAGLCNVGYRVVTYTLSQFYLRAFEAVRNEVGLNGAPIVMLGSSTGYENGPLGGTHTPLDDWGALKAIPGIDIYCPSSVAYAETLIDKVLDTNRPAYIRIPKGGFHHPATKRDMALYVGIARNVLLVSYGSTVQACLEAQERDPRLSVLVVNKLSPIDMDAAWEALRGFKHAFVVEDHFGNTGLYGSICGLAGACPNVISLAPSSYDLKIGSQAYMNAMAGIDVEGILRAVV